MARTVLPIAGAIVGAAFGAPQIGWMIGSVVGNAIDPQRIKGPRIGDVNLQTSQEGTPRPIVYGTAAVMGNLIDRGPLEKVITQDRQGKGGGPVVENESLYMTFAIRICEGPIKSVSRIWEDEKLVYDVRPESTILDDSAKYAQGFTLYKGEETQLPDPDLEMIHGVGNTPAYRGSAYIVFKRKNLTDRRGSIPQFRFEVNGCITSISTAQTPPIAGIDWLTAETTGAVTTFDLPLPQTTQEGDLVFYVYSRPRETAENPAWRRVGVATDSGFVGSFSTNPGANFNSRWFFATSSHASAKVAPLELFETGVDNSLPITGSKFIVCRIAASLIEKVPNGTSFVHDARATDGFSSVDPPAVTPNFAADSHIVLSILLARTGTTINGYPLDIANVSVPSDVGVIALSIATPAAVATVDPPPWGVTLQGAPLRTANTVVIKRVTQ